MKKKLMALLLSLAMATSAVPEAMTFAADTSVAEATETEETLLEDSGELETELGSESEEGVTDEALSEETADEAVGSDEINTEEEGIFEDEIFKYKKISETEAVIAGVVSDELSEINIPSEVFYEDLAYSVTGVEKDALSEINAETLNIPSTVTVFGGQVLPSLKNIVVAEENAVFFTKDGVLFSRTETEDKNVLVLYPAAAEAESYVVPIGTVEIAEEAFANVARLKTLVLQDGIEKIASYAVKTAANPMEIAFAFYTAPTEIGESAFYLDGANGNVFYFRSAEDYEAVSAIQPTFADSSALYDEEGMPIEDTSSVINVVTEGIPESILDIINSVLDEDKDLEETEKPEDESEADKSLTEKVPDDSSVTDSLKDESVTEEALVGVDPKELDAKIEAGYYAIQSQLVNKNIKVRNSAIKESTDLYLAGYSLDMGGAMSIVPLGDGVYKIVAACSNKALSLSAKAGSGVTIVQKTYTGDKSQQWYIRELSTGLYKIHSVENDKFVLDIKGQSTESGAAIILESSNSNKGQGWKFVKRANPTQDHLPNGIYTISTALSSKKVLDVEAGSKSAGANIQIYDSNNTDAQKFILRYLGYGSLFRVVNVASNKILDTKDHKTGNGTNVLQANQTSSVSAQLWRIVKGNDGKYVCYNASCNKVLDVAAGSTANGANVQIYQWNGTTAQKWNIKKVSGTDAVDIDGEDANIAEGWYTMRTAGTAKVIAVKNSSIANNADICLQEPGLGERTYFHIEPIGNGKYEIRAFCSNKLLTNQWGGDSKDAGNIVQSTDTDLSTQRWYIRVSKKNKNYLSIVSSSDQNYVMTLKDDKMVYGNTITAALSTGVRNQRWMLNNIGNPEIGAPYHNHTYKMQSFGNAKVVLSTEGQSKQNQANVQLMTKVNGAGEMWKFMKVGYGNLYRITNAYTGLSLDAKNGGTANGTNIWQYTANNTDAQLWRIMPTDTTKTKFVIFNAASGKALDVYAGNLNPGANIQLYQMNNTNAQYWKFTGADINKFIPVNTAVTLRQKGNTGRLVEVKDGSKDNGAVVQVYAERGNTDQSFIFYRKDAGVYKIKNIASNKYLDIKTQANGGEVISTAAKDVESQLWVIQPTGDNDASFYILNKKTDLALTSAYANNTKVVCKAYEKALAQKFYFDTPVIKTGWQKIGSNWRYYDKNGNAYRESFLEDGKYYFDKNGNVLTGWKKYGAFYYYFKGKNGREYTDNRPYMSVLFGSISGKSNSQPRPNCQYYFTIDTNRCVVTWYTKYPGTNDYNVPVVAFLCSPGTDATPTDHTERKTGYTRRWIDLMGPSYGQYGTECKAYTYNPASGRYEHINTGEYFHSVACGAPNDHNLNPNVYNLLGTKQSHGCIRLGVRNAYWVYNFVDAGTLGVCRAGNLSAPLRTLPQPLATIDVDPTDPGRTGNWGYTDSGATAYPVPGYIARG